MTTRLGAFGWTPDPIGTLRFSAALGGSLADTHPQLLAAASGMDQLDALNYRALARVLGQEKLRSLNQGNAGTCVGHATATACEVTLAVAIAKRAPWKWEHRVSRDGMYALGRTLSNQLGSWDGSSGWAAVQAVHEAGVIWERAYDVGGRTYDLSKYSIPTARDWARRGVPRELIAEAKRFPLLRVVHVQALAELDAVILAGGGVNLCSGVGFDRSRDKDGFIRRRGSWSHSMACTSRRTKKTTGRDGYLIHQSWGDDWTDGPYWPEDQPLGSFWAEPDDVQDMLAEGDSYGYLAPTGEAVRQLDFQELL